MDATKQKLMCALVAVLLHVVVAVAVCQESILNWLFPEPKKVAEKVEDDKVVMSFVITPKTQVVANQVKVVTPPQKPRFTRTSAEQPQQKPKVAKFFGAHDTVAQSSAKVDSTAPERASVDGESSDASTLASNYQAGDVTDKNVGEQAAEAVAQIPAETEPDEQPPTKPVEKNVVAEPDAGKSLAASNAPLVDYLESLNKAPTQQRSEKPLKDIVDPDKGKANSHDPLAKHHPQKATSSKQPKESVAVNASAGEKGFVPPVKTGKVIGSISRKGALPSSDVEATPLGKYRQAVLSAIHSCWVKDTSDKPNLYEPGDLTVRWYVYAPGKVKDALPVDDNHCSSIQKGYVFKALHSAKIPPMPKALRKDLNGEPIEITIKFNYH